MCLVVKKVIVFKPNFFQRLIYAKNVWSDYYKPLGVIIAKEDIICYKVYSKNKWGQLESPFQYHETEIGLQPKVKLGISSTPYQFDIEEGYHSLTKLTDKFIRNCSVRNAVLIECVIPKGTKYVIGDWGGAWDDRNNAYASERIQLIKEIPFPKN